MRIADAYKSLCVPCRYVRYFAMSLDKKLEQRRVCLRSVSIGGLNWLGSGKTLIKVSCRPTGASEAAKVAKEYLNDRRRASFGHCSLEGDIKIEVGSISASSRNLVTC